MGGYDFMKPYRDQMKALGGPSAFKAYQDQIKALGGPSAFKAYQDEMKLLGSAGVAEVVRIVVELRDGDPLNELSQTAETATSGAGVEGVV